MNLVYIQGKIISKIQFEFIYKNKNISIAEFVIQMQNKTITYVRAYNENADYAYRKLAKEDIVCIEGNVTNEGIIANEIYCFL